MGDRFQTEHMVGEEALHHEDKRVSRGMTALLGVWAPFCWALAAYIAVANASSSQPVPEAALPFVVGAIGLLGAMFLGLALTFAVLRTVVTDTQVVVKYGLWGPEIPLASITSCKVVDYEWTSFGGFGIRRGAGGVWAYVPGPGEVVEITYEDGSMSKTVQVGAQDARSLSLAINRARSAKAGLRVEVADEDALAEEAALAEEEALAEEREQQR